MSDTVVQGADTAPVQAKVYKPMTIAELKEQGKEAQIMVPDAFHFVKSQTVTDEKSGRVFSLQFNKSLRQVLEIRHKHKGAQLELAETQEIVAFWTKREADRAVEHEEKREERNKLLDLKRDETYPDEKDVCFFQSCRKEFEPMQRFKLIWDDEANALKYPYERQISKITDEEILMGNYKVVDTRDDEMVPAGTGTPKSVPLCQDCAKLVGAESYTFAGGKAEEEKAIAARQNVKDRAQEISRARQSLVRGDGTPRFQGGSAADDMARTADYLANRRNKRDFRGGRDRR